MHMMPSMRPRLFSVSPKDLLLMRCYYFPSSSLLPFFFCASSFFNCLGSFVRMRIVGAWWWVGGYFSPPRELTYPPTTFEFFTMKNLMFSPIYNRHNQCPCRCLLLPINKETGSTTTAVGTNFVREKHGSHSKVIWPG